MLLRIVRMTFQPDQIDEFTSLFDSVSKKIRNFDGCSYLKLMRDHNHHNIFVTYSKWESQTHLDEYRNSELFKNTWVKTKALFADKPAAFSLEEFSGEIES